MKKKAWMLFSLLSVLLPGFTAGCSREAAALSGAVYSSQIPVYPAADFEDTFGGTGSDSIGGPPTSESMSWFFNVTDPKEKVVAFYAEKLPQAERSELDDCVTFQFAPKGAEEYEWVWVRIKPGKLQLTESVRYGKRKD
jgi:hypothetical protein